MYVRLIFITIYMHKPICKWDNCYLKYELGVGGIMVDEREPKLTSLTFKKLNLIGFVEINK